ncbi:MAG TPA: phosphatidate cytidylyltransferase [Acidobacteriaceae bacterium]|jgi:phosphatidate cytidylyltransferase|nr:phosphatidate cytidylyltransferase [Acidobacteriaceae bacterium]
MKRILTAVVLVPIVILLIFFSPTQPLPMMGAIFVVSMLAIWEFLGLADAMGAKTPRLVVVVALALLLATVFRRSDLLEPILGILSFALFLVCVFRSPVNRVLPDTAYSIFGLIYIGLPMGMLYLLSTRDNGPSLLLFLFMAVWCGDVAALYIGRAFGRRKLAPKLSPNKTWEGSVASVAGSILITLLLVWVSGLLVARNIESLSYPGPILHWITLAILVNIGAQLGDLVESAIKRGAGVKDSGHLLPGHGGMLDRIDALLLAAPLLWYAQLAQQTF